MSAKSEMYEFHSRLMAERGLNYYGRPRDEVLALIPLDTERLLEVGCGGGATLHEHQARARRVARTCTTIGVDLADEAIDQAGRRLDHVIQMDMEEDPVPDIPGGPVDILVMHFVLEHVVNPWATLRRWLPAVKPGGSVIVGVPNLANWAFVRRLVVGDDFAYEPDGVLDWTHLRYFTRTSLRRLLHDAGLQDIEMSALPEREELGRMARAATRLVPPLERWFAYGYVAKARYTGEVVESYVPFGDIYTIPV